MKKYLFVVLVFFYGCGSQAKELDYLAGARQITDLLLNPGEQGISRLQYWSGLEPYFFGCMVAHHFGLLDNSDQPRCIFFDNDELEESRSYTLLFPDSESIKFAARYFSEAALNQPYTWNHQKYDRDHYESLCLHLEGSREQRCLIPSDAFIPWKIAAGIWGSLTLMVVFLILKGIFSP